MPAAKRRIAYACSIFPTSLQHFLHQVGFADLCGLGSRQLAAGNCVRPIADLILWVVNYSRGTIAFIRYTVAGAIGRTAGGDGVVTGGPVCAVCVVTVDRLHRYSGKWFVGGSFCGCGSWYRWTGGSGGRYGSVVVENGVDCAVDWAFLTTTDTTKIIHAQFPDENSVESFSLYPLGLKKIKI